MREAFRLPTRRGMPVPAAMELQLNAETEAKLNELAFRTHRGTDELVQEAIDHLVTYNAWFEQKVNRSIAAVECGRTVPDEDVRTWIEQRNRT
jgi:predicted transcriptional regulator